MLSIMKLAATSEPGDSASNDDRLMGTRQQVNLPLRSALHDTSKRWRWTVERVCVPWLWLPCPVGRRTEFNSKMSAAAYRIDWSPTALSRFRALGIRSISAARPSGPYGSYTAVFCSQCITLSEWRNWQTR